VQRTLSSRIRNRLGGIDRSKVGAVAPWVESRSAARVCLGETCNGGVGRGFADVGMYLNPTRSFTTEGGEFTGTGRHDLSLLPRSDSAPIADPEIH
jgi:hypothetical protein